MNTANVTHPSANAPDNATLDGATDIMRAGYDPILLRRIEPARNMARWYTLSLEVTLFDDWSCTRSYGRIGQRGGRVMIGLFEDHRSAEAELQAILRAKQARGYEITG
jgi:predicted DNA-binding WGR domain protein